MSENRGNRREVVGVVISDKMDKTITVRIAYTAQHPVFKKTIKKFTKFKAHDEKNQAKTGDKVRICETRPLSKTKTWRLIQVLEKATIK